MEGAAGRAPVAISAFLKRRRSASTATLSGPANLASAKNKSTPWADRKSTRLNSSHSQISYAVFCLKKKNNHVTDALTSVTPSTNKPQPTSISTLVLCVTNSQRLTVPLSARRFNDFERVALDSARP